MKEIKGLPEEVLLKMHSLLPPRDLKSAVLVDKWWKTVGENPYLWRWCVVTVRNREDIAKFSTRRLRRIQNIRLAPGAICGNDDWELLLQTVEKLPELKNIDGLRNQNLEAVDPDLLARVLTWVENVDLWCTNLSNAQITSILQHVLLDTTKLKKLCLKGHDLSDIETEVLARAVNKLEDVSLEDTELNTSQITRILTNVVKDNTNLKTLDLNENDLSDVEIEVLARAVNRLAQVDLRFNWLSTQQITSILTNIIDEDSKLKQLKLANNDLSEIEEDLLAAAVNKLEEVNLYDTELNTSQIIRIFTHVIQKNSKLKKLDLSGNHFALLGVDEELLARVVNRLEEMDLDDTKLSSLQISSILRYIVDDKTKLKKIFDKWEIDLSDVEEELLIRVVNNVEEVDLEQAGLSTKQIINILTHVGDKDSELKKLKLMGNDLSVVGKKVLARAVNILEEVDLHDTNLSTAQITSILTHVVEQDSKLKRLELREYDLSAVEKELLAKAFNRLEEVDLYRAKLSTLQITSILKLVIEQESKLKKLRLGSLSGVEKEVLARGINTLEEVDLEDSDLSTLQVTSILTHIMQENSKLKELNLSCIDLSFVEEEVLANAVNKLENVDLNATNLKIAQINSILTHVMDQNSKLKKLSMYGNDLSEVEEEVLASSTNKLGSSNIGYS